MVKLGFCTAFSNLDLLEKAGIDNLETTVYEIMQWSDEQVRENMKKLGSSSVRFESCNCLIGGFSLYEDHDWSKTDAYFARVLPRLAEVGMKKLVFGSGGYRRVPEGMEMEAARGRILEFLTRLSEKMKPYGMTAVIEPLFQKGCNIINTSAEGAEYVRELGLPNIRLLIDYRHFIYEGEHLTAIENYEGILTHTHIAHPVTFATPARWDCIDYVGWFRVLDKIGYQGAVVAESSVFGDLLTELEEFRITMEEAYAAAVGKR